MKVSGHLWTVWPRLLQRVAAPELPAEVPWQLELDDPFAGRVRLTGRLSAPVGSTGVVILVHGLGGSLDSYYMALAARAASDLGLASLRLNLRGADGRGDDFYHVGLSEDLARVAACPELAPFEELFVLGFSLGGHVGLAYATEPGDPRLRGVAAVSSPIDPGETVRDFDQPSLWAYRRYVLSRLFDLYERLHYLDRMPTSPEELRRVRTLRDFDRLTVVPRFGFDSPEDYYHRAGVARRLGRLRVPALLVAAEEDPMVSARSVRAGLENAGAGADAIHVEWVGRGGHVGFPDDLDLGQDAPPGVAPQALGWMLGYSSQATRSPTAISPSSSTSP